MRVRLGFSWKLAPFQADLKGALWNQAQHEPQLAGFDEDVGIEIKGHHCSTGDSRTWYQACVGWTPTEMLIPTICAWVEQAYHPSSARIRDIDAITAQEPLDWRRRRAVRRAAFVRRAQLIRPEGSTRSGRMAR